ncbi:hypothetical protein ACHHYP_11069 [Achlya hypogyna]|uniref:ZZ-type domain-containing protein n=1 Tax=Achlya hypogyna TaxID=1202772 RepID=A0A1V9YJW3_ACHHY|nr:hypothetical protein ACHHYP_11069 [Achlya hypogyna]
MAGSPPRGIASQDSLCTPQFDDPEDDAFAIDDFSGHAFYAPSGDLHGLRHLAAEVPAFLSTVANASLTSEDDEKEPSPATAPRASRYYSAISGLKSLSSASSLIGKGKYAKAQLLAKIPYKRTKKAARVANLPPATPVLCSQCPPKAPSKLSLYRQKSTPLPLWTCSECPDVHLCDSCYKAGAHGLEGSEAMDVYDIIVGDLAWMKTCKAFTRQLLMILRQDICKNSPPKFQFMCQWLADILGTKPVAKITMRGVAMKDVAAESRQAFVAALMPLVANRSDLEVNIEWAPASSEDDHLENLRLWISDKKGRRESPFETSLLTTDLHDT